jgi:hypothetical protein
METLTLNAGQIKQLEIALLEIPGKFSIPILQLLTSFAQENNKHNVSEVLVEES